MFKIDNGRKYSRFFLMKWDDFWVKVIVLQVLLHFLGRKNDLKVI